MEAIRAVTDAKGSYRCSTSAAGTYVLRAEKAGYATVSVGPFELGPGRGKSIDLTLKPLAESVASAAAPQFYDEPQFTVAGVADIANNGGHGSDAVSRTAQSLAKDLNALDRNSPSTESSPTASFEQSLRQALTRNPANSEANQQLGFLLMREGKSDQALPYLERARRDRPDDYATAHALAQTYLDTGQLAKARDTARAGLATNDRAGWHHLLGDLEERQKNSVEAVHEYQRAAELDPSEENLFDWGAELLTHRALEPAIQVFTKGNRLHPQSARILVGLGVAWYAAGSPDRGANYVCLASDLDPANPAPYLVLGKMQVVESSGPAPVTERLERFARLHPENALANYYYAVILWKQQGASHATGALHQIETLLEKAVQLDPKLAPAFLQLGVLREEQDDLSKAIAAYQSAIAADPQLAEAHYRLAQTYRRTGQTAKAKEELALSDEISRKNTQQAEEQGREIPQFVYTLRHPAPPPQ